MTSPFPGLFARLDAWCNAGLDPAGTPPERLRRARLASLFLLIAGGADLFFVPNSFFLGHYENTVAFTIAGLLLIALGRLLRRGRVELAAMLLAALCTATLQFGMWFSGGPDSSAVAWIPVCFTLYPLLLRPRAGLAFAAANLALTVGVLWAWSTGHVPHADRHSTNVSVDVVGACISLVILVTVYIHGERQATARREEGLRRLEAEVVRRTEAEREARSAEQLKTSFLATMSHEIRTPLNGVLGMAELLAATALDAQQREMLATVTSSGQLLLRVINDTLDLSRLQAGGMRLVAVPFSPATAADEVRALLRGDPRAAGLALRLAVAPEVPAWVCGDGVRFRQILLNLAGNAVKFTAAGHVTLRLSAPAPDRLRVEVEDTGPGIAPADQARLFTPFTQLDGTLRRQHGGTGLGLAIVAGLARAMDGAAGVDSAPGAGATFWVELGLPACGPPAAATAGPAAEDPAPATEGGRVLVAEDVDVNATVLGHMLDRLGVAWERVADGAAAVARAAEGGWDLVLMDCQMPVMDGLAATRALRAEGCELPVIGVTANAMPEDRARCLAAGMDDHLTKPVRMAALEALLLQWGALRPVPAVSPRSG